jgi:homoserine O-acetyltransferase
MDAPTVILDHIPNFTNVYFNFVADQRFALLDSFQLESGVILNDVTVAYKTWGKLNANRDNCLIICHALSGSSDIEDWWGPLLGIGKAFDLSRYFIFCANVLGSPYGTTSSLSLNPATGRIYGPDFPQTTIRDDVRYVLGTHEPANFLLIYCHSLHQLVLDALNVASIAAVVGGSMGGMATLEWPLCTPSGYVKNIVPISTSVDHDAWGISWAEAQRQCIFADPAFENGYYLPTPTTQPSSGLSAARMVGMLTYRSSPSFSSRFGRASANKDHLQKSKMKPQPPTTEIRIGSDDLADRRPVQVPKFTAQSYLQYHGQKFVKRFDANCFIHLTRKMDHHDITRDRVEGDLAARIIVSRNAILRKVLHSVPTKALVVGIASDVLFTPEQQEVLVNTLPDASLVMIPSPEGHDGFLLEFEILGPLIEDHLKERCSWIYDCPPLVLERSVKEVKEVKDSVFGEVESGW